MSDAAQPRALLLNIWIAGQLMGALLERNLAREGVHTGFYATVSVIGAFGPLTPSELAERTGGSSPRKRRGARVGGPLESLVTSGNFVGGSSVPHAG